jgi:hypothetical protein
MGGGVVMAIAATLWIAYLLPTWMRRREYLATERTAVRLQQTLRILAATSELPEEIRLEANAKAIAEQQRVLRKVEARALAEARATAAAQARAERVASAHAARLAEAQAARLAEAQAFAEHQDSVAQAEYVARAQATARYAAASSPITAPTRARTAASAQSRSRGLRRARAATSLMLLVALVAVGFGSYSFATAGAWVLLASGATVVIGSFVVLARLARAGRVATRTVVTAAQPVSTELYDHSVLDAPEPVTQSTWTPQPLPKPLHLSRGTVAASAMASIEAAAELRRAAAAAEIAERAAELEAELAPVPIRPAAAAPDRAASTAADTGLSGSTGWAIERERAAQSRFASMGMIDESRTGAIDLDAAMRRRRAAS